MSSFRTAVSSYRDKNERYRRFASEAGLIRYMGTNELPYLLTRRKRDWRERQPSDFDHTTFWRFTGERLCSVVLTEPYPYSRSSVVPDEWFPYAVRHGLLFAVGDTARSLWVPGKTVPVVWFRSDAKDKPEIMGVLRYFDAQVVGVTS